MGAIRCMPAELVLSDTGNQGMMFRTISSEECSGKTSRAFHGIM